jgi:nucleoside-diphosphate-sugar epimerase
MRVIVTGASGFIGRNVLLGAPRDWEIVAVAHRTPGLEAFVAHHRLPHVRVVRCDLMDADAVRALAAVTGRADAALYLAANGDPAASAERPRWDLESNTVALVTFLEHCPVEHLVYLSSGAVYDGSVGAVSPSTPAAPRLPYAIPNWPQITTFVFLGAASHARELHQRPLLRRLRTLRGGAEDHDPMAARAGRRPARVPLRGNGENLIDFVHVDDAVDGMLRLVQAAGTSATVDFSSGHSVSVNARGPGDGADARR